MKALFIPLKTKYFEHFLSGQKKHEIRVYGPRWNERTCIIGRPVVISKGYGKYARITGKVSSFERVTSERISNYGAAMREIWGTNENEFARIGIELDEGQI